MSDHEQDDRDNERRERRAYYNAGVHRDGIMTALSIAVATMTLLAGVFHIATKLVEVETRLGINNALIVATSHDRWTRSDQIEWSRQLKDLNDHLQTEGKLRVPVILESTRSRD